MVASGLLETTAVFTHFFQLRQDLRNAGVRRGLYAIMGLIPVLVGAQNLVKPLGRNGFGDGALHELRGAVADEGAYFLEGALRPVIFKQNMLYSVMHIR